MMGTWTVIADGWQQPAPGCDGRAHDGDSPADLYGNGGKPNRLHTPPFVPFQYGPRTCLGMNMAYLEVKVMAALILQQQPRLSLRLAPGHRIVPAPAVTIFARYGMWMNVVRER